MRHLAIDSARRRVGLALYATAGLAGLGLLLFTFLVPPLFAGNPLRHYGAMLLGALLAVPAGTIYVTVPRLLDRYDPEPWYALVGCLLWGGVVAAGFSAVINSAVAAVGTGLGGPQFGAVLGTVIAAPFVEEFFKCLGVWGVFYFLRGEFDGVVDGIIYATFTALGFATVENILYYGQAAQTGELALVGTVFLRGVMFPWVHPVYTAMFGVGIGIARETTQPWLRIAAPLVGFAAAVFLHGMWNGTAMLFEGVLFVMLLPLWFMLVMGFLAGIVILVRRRGRIIREHLTDEVALGNLSETELTLICSAFGTLRARSRYGARGADFVRAAARLALHKWHHGRALRGKYHTMSADFIAPLRQQLAELRPPALASAVARSG